ncbi:MAG: hypothetical protein HXY37_07980 [Chloroflexi bacterium]|nr:hypothetical protein [Chloroflexota bacterium]
MLRTSIVALCTLAMLAAMLAAPATPGAEAQTGGLRLIAETILPNSNQVKYPHVVAGNNLVHATGNANRSTAFYWSKGASEASFGNPFDLGPAEGKEDYSPTSVALGPDGSIWAAWINQPTRTIFLRQRTPQGQWGPTRIVDRGTPFPVSVEVTVSTTNQIFVAWRDPGLPVRYRTSSNGGVSWTSRTNASDLVAYGSPLGLVAGPEGRVALTFTAGFGEKLQIFAGLWDGSGFNISRITTLAGDWADSSISFDQQGRVFAAWRGVATSGGNSGVFYAERQPDGSWPRSRIVGGSVVGTVNINFDQQNNLHLSWIGQPSGSNQIFYAFKPATSDFRGPIASAAGGTLFNARASANVAASGPLNHIVTEEFSGSGLRTRYSLFSADSFGGQPVIENDSTLVGRSADSTVLVSFPSLQGSPDQIRWRWNAAPTDAVNDSGGWQAFSNPLRVVVPEALYGDTSCLPATLFTQLRDTRTGAIEAQARSDSIQIDGVVEVNVYLENPLARAVRDGTPPAPDGGAPGGAANYTRYPFTYLNVIPDTDCNGLTTASVGQTATTIETTYQLSESGFAGRITLPGFSGDAAGARPFVTVVRDRAGNSRTFDLNVIYDPQKPVLNQQTAGLATPGQVTVTPHPRYDLLQDLQFENIPLDDDIYPDEIWGVWMANAPERVADPLNDPNLRWTIVEAFNVRSGSFRVSNWSLATGLDSQDLVPGEDYYIYIRFLDGAGNASDGYVVAEVPVSNLTRPLLYAPLIGR